MKARDVEVTVTDDAEAAARQVAGLLGAAARAGDEIVLTGGATPARAYELAAELEPDWSKSELWWGDERCVPPASDQSNFGLAQKTLLQRLARAPRAVHRIRGEIEAEAAAAEYEQQLAGVVLDFVLLGLGPDGHVASLFPNSPGLEAERLVVPAEPKLEPYVERVTLTPEPLRAGRMVVFLVTGESKADAVAKAVAGPPEASVPGSLIRSVAGRTIAVVDRAATARLGGY
jgi:6-phosphogluconolactonase